jgi:hypothetical protein
MTDNKGLKYYTSQVKRAKTMNTLTYQKLNQITDTAYSKSMNIMENKEISRQNHLEVCLLRGFSILTHAELSQRKPFPL